MKLSLEEKIGYTFKDRKLLQKAIVHPSFTKNRRNHDFERLEFLGDRVLGLAIADIQFKKFKKESEGDFAKRQAFLVSRKICGTVAESINLEQFLKAEHDTMSANSSIMANAMESLIGAIFLDGGYLAAKKMIETLWHPFFHDDKLITTDAKTSLQQWSQLKGFGLPHYDIVSREGLAHNPVFTVEAKVATWKAKGTGTTKKEAEQIAAEKILLMIEEEKKL